ncbi:MAG: SDR family NAD(P)-dependent oxidoreductase [Deinococcales bacterium]
MSLETKCCAITGAASGIGEALVWVFAKASYDIIAIDLDEHRLNTLQIALKTQGYSCQSILADLARASDLTKIVNMLPRVDVFIHSAGISAVGEFGGLEPPPQLSVLDINLLAPLSLTSKVLATDKLSKGSSLIFISSLAHFVSYPSASSYAASKTGLAAYARSLRIQLAPQGIHVLTVFPGPTRTPHAQKYSPDNRREAKRMPPEQVAEAIFKAVNTKQAILIPGVTNKLFALLGWGLPHLTESFMRQSMMSYYRKS